MVSSSGQIKQLKKVEASISAVPKEEDEATIGKEAHLWLYDIPVAVEGVNKGKKFEGSCYFDKIPKGWKTEWQGKTIDRSDWRIEDPVSPDAEFRAFVSSHIPRFDQLKAYKNFWLYCEQARRWLADAVDISDVPAPERYDWKKEEFRRIRQNKLYGLNRYITIKEDNKAAGRRKFVASTPQALLAFLVDSGVSFDLVKGRQAAITSTMMAIAALESIVRNSYSGVFVVHKKDGTGKKLFRDKYKSTLQHLPAWMRVGFDEDGWSAERVYLDFDKGDKKGDKGRDASEFILLSAEDSMVVNGQTPTQSFFDEAQNIPTYQAIKGEIDPTMYQFNERTGRMELVRSVYAWGTGSSNSVGKGSFESDFKGLLEAWQSGESTDGWVPVFMDWTCRPGMTREHYMRMRGKYLRGQTEEAKGLSKTERLSLFLAHYPSQPDDAFMTTHKTLLPMELIVEYQTACTNSPVKPIPGRFVPLFDETKPLPPGSMFPFVVKSAMWEEAPADDVEAPILMMFPPEQGWANRYFQGTDPIQNDGGFSRFSSAIWDSVGLEHGEGDQTQFLPTVACMLNARTAFPQDLFAQCALMGMYYANHGQRACKEVVEINAGGRYVDAKCGPEFNLKDSLIFRGALPPAYRGGAHVYGVDLKGGKGSRKEALYHDTTNLLRTNGKRIFYYGFWSQVRNISVESKADGSVQWGTMNKNAFNDDMVYAVAYAELACRAINQQPVRVDRKNPITRPKKVLKRDKNLMPYYEVVQVPVTYR